MSTNPFGNPEPSPFGESAPGDVESAESPEAAARNRKPLIIGGAAAGAAALLAAAWFLVPGMPGASSDDVGTTTASAPVPAKPAAPSVTPSAAVPTESATTTPQFGRNPFYPLVTEGTTSGTSGASGSAGTSYTGTSNSGSSNIGSGSSGSGSGTSTGKGSSETGTGSSSGSGSSTGTGSGTGTPGATGATGPQGPTGPAGPSYVYISLGFDGAASSAGKYVVVIQGMPVEKKIGEALGSKELVLKSVTADPADATKMIATVTYKGKSFTIKQGEQARFFLVSATSVS